MKVAVIGCGVMGHGIAQLFAQRGYQVNLMARHRSSLSKACEQICDSLRRFESKGVIESSSNVLDRINFTCKLNEAVSNVGFIIDCISENLDMKGVLFVEVDSLTSEDVIIASNTSSLSITELAEFTGRPEKVCGMHFFNPPQLMKLVEVIKGTKTSDETVLTVSSLAKDLGKDVIVEKDYSIVNRILFPALNEAMLMYFEGLSYQHYPQVIDEALKLGLNLKMGFLALADFIGLDTVLSIMKILKKRTNVKYHCIPYLEQMTENGFLGRKSGRGFHKYDSTS